MSRPAPRFPPLSIHFTKQISQGLHIHPFGGFIVTNLSGQPLAWSGCTVEAPSDPVLAFSAGFDSNIQYGRLDPDTSTNFRAIIPHTKGTPFRILIGYHYDPPPIDRLRANLSQAVPLLDQIWPLKNPTYTFTSQWFHATSDYPEELGLTSNAPPR